MINLKKLREESDVTLGKLAEATNLPLAYLREVEAGNKELSSKAIDRIATFVGSNNGASHNCSFLSAEGLGDKIRALREEKGVSLEEASQKLGLSLSYLSEVERGKRTPSLQSIYSICRYFNIPVSLLISTPAKMRVIGQKIKLNREYKGLTQKQLANMSGLSAGLIAQLEAAKVQPSLKTIESLAGAMGVSVCYLILEQEDVEGVIAGISPELRELLYEPQVQMIIGNICMMDGEEIKLVLDFIHMLKNRKV